MVGSKEQLQSTFVVPWRGIIGGETDQKDSSLPHASSVTNDIYFRIILVMVFFIALAYSARKQWVTFREFVASGVVLVIFAAILVFEITIPIAVAQFGHNTTALLWGVFGALPYPVSVAVGVFLIARRLKAMPPIPTKRAGPKSGRKARRGQGAGSTSVANAPDAAKPKPVRSKGARRRF